ncbi:hypothetical protein BDF14DRAFT_1831620 [Spinellus fusiger]|nr:hypothetical protein BDF14DRAFT_1831620 [Spinellus fusiger]
MGRYKAVSCYCLLLFQVHRLWTLARDGEATEMVVGVLFNRRSPSSGVACNLLADCINSEGCSCDKRPRTPVSRATEMADPAIHCVNVCGYILLLYPNNLAVPNTTLMHKLTDPPNKALFLSSS